MRQEGSHNSYERTEGYDDQEIYWRQRGVEMDIHNGKGCTGAPALDGDWCVCATARADDLLASKLGRDALWGPPT